LFLDKNGTLPNLIALEVCRQILLGLSCAHSRGVYHRDIKPDNIIIDPEGVVKIMDFGIAYIVNRESVTMTGSFIGSARYISPEQADGKPLAGTTDIFSLGVLLYVSLTGTLPFDAEVAAAVVHSIIHDTPPPVFKRKGAVLFWLSDMVDAFLQKDPRTRPDSSAALSRIEKECLQHGITLGKERLRRFLDSPERYGEAEKLELFDLYRARAQKAAREKRMVAALRSLEQAKAFGLLTKEDERIAARHVLKRRLMMAVAAVFLLLAGGAGLYPVFRGIPHRGARPHETEIAAAVARPAEPPQAANTQYAAADSIRAERSRVNGKTARNAVPLPALAGPAAQSGAVPAVTGYVKIQTNPPWAKVSIDDIERGVTPAMSVFPLPTGQHELRIVKEGFSEYRRTFSVSGVDTMLLRIQLTQRPAVGEDVLR
jgi:hypothetical protein